MSTHIPTTRSLVCLRLVAIGLSLARTIVTPDVSPIGAGVLAIAAVAVEATDAYIAQRQPDQGQ